jgi:ubiquinone/menaquinone biosynthesis C-methylase UbiE
MVAFGVRNFENLEKGMEEMLRVLNQAERYLYLNVQYPEIFY